MSCWSSATHLTSQMYSNSSGNKSSVLWTLSMFRNNILIDSNLCMMCCERATESVYIGTLLAEALRSS